MRVEQLELQRTGLSIHSGMVPDLYVGRISDETKRLRVTVDRAFLARAIPALHVTWWVVATGPCEQEGLHALFRRAEGLHNGRETPVRS